MHLTDYQKRDLLGLLWDNLEMSSRSDELRLTGWGVKSQGGLVACVESIINGHPGEFDASIAVFEGSHI